MSVNEGADDVTTPFTEGGDGADESSDHTTPPGVEGSRGRVAGVMAQNTPRLANDGPEKDMFTDSLTDRPWTPIKTPSMENCQT
jgi:hypothetical protein